MGVGTAAKSPPLRTDCWRGGCQLVEADHVTVAGCLDRETQWREVDRDGLPIVNAGRTTNDRQAAKSSSSCNDAITVQQLRSRVSTQCRIAADLLTPGGLRQALGTRARVAESMRSRSRIKRSAPLGRAPEAHG